MKHTLTNCAESKLGRSSRYAYVRQAAFQRPERAGGAGLQGPGGTE